VPSWRRHHLHASSARLLLLLALAVALFLAGTAGMAYVAGLHAVWRIFQHPHWPWVVATAVAVGVAFAGYYYGYRGVGNVEDGPRDLDTRARLAVVAAGFGGFLAHGGTGLDEDVMRAAGASEREAKVRVTLIAGLEHGLLAVPCSIAAIVLLIQGAKKPPLDFLFPWAVLPAVGFATALWAAERYRAAWRQRSGWRGKMSIGLDTAHLVGVMLRHPLQYFAGLAGMLVFWLADMFGLWAGMAAFGFRMNWGADIVALGTAMIVTRRTGPLGGAGVLECALPPTLWQCGAPWPAAVLGTFAYRFFTLWLPLPFSFASLPRLRELVPPDAD
jgi:uncharacterized membrane protein YbhN (UPF0104 family)